VKHHLRKKLHEETRNHPGGIIICRVGKRYARATTGVFPAWRRRYIASGAICHGQSIGNRAFRN
jgi:hypothetical protein